MRSLACACFVLAAFAWVPPFLDRAGLAALGFAFLALSVGRASGVARPALFSPRGRPEAEALPDVEPVLRDLSERLAAYDD